MLVVAPLVPSDWARAQAESPTVPAPTDSSRIDRLEAMVRSLAEENRRLSGEVHELKEQLSVREPVATTPVVPTPDLPSPNLPTPTPSLASPPPVAPLAGEHPFPSAMPEPAQPGNSSIAQGPRTEKLFDGFKVGYDKGFVIVPEDLDSVPFSLKINFQDVFRYDGFVRGATFWIDSAGNRVAIDNSNYFGIPRGRIIFSGTALLPKLTYLLNIDYNSVTSNPIGFRAYVLSYRFSRAFQLSVGQSKVPGSREWLESAFSPLQSADRSMATTFFRPSLSQGVWITGEPLDAVYYHAMMSNGFNTLNLLPNRLNNRFCWSASAWWEPWGDFGKGYSDLQMHEDAAIRLGGSYTFAVGRGSQSESDAVENSPVRLSDGTIITTPGALAPGVTLQRYDLSLAAIDLAYKYRGLGLSTELYFQNLLNFQGTGPLPIHSTAAFGGFVKGGYFIIPRRAELYARVSYVTGHYGSGSELGGGFNWFFLPGRENLFYTLDTVWLEHSPAGQNRTGFVAGQTGFLLRTQITVAY